MESLETRAGLYPSKKQLPYAITTSIAEKYLQDKVDVICAKAKELPNSVDVKLYTTEPGRNFAPFVIVLPTSVLVEKGKKNRENKNVDAFFDNKTYSDEENLLEPFKKLFGAYTFNKHDVKAFMSNDWRRARGVDRRTSDTLRSMALPRTNSYGSGDKRVTVVTFLIDPLRLFYDMLKMKDDNRDYHVEIERWEKVKDGEFRYYVKRMINRGKKNKYGDTIARELNRRMRGGGR